MPGFGVRGGMATDAELLAAGASDVFDNIGGLISVLERAAAREKVS
jgi:hypothetical protein